LGTTKNELVPKSKDLELQLLVTPKFKEDTLIHLLQYNPGSKKE